MNTLLYAIYDDPSGAEQATQKLIGMGIAQDAVLVITAAVANSREGRAHMSSFADSGAHTHATERDHIGSFADSGAHTHDAERDHVGSFADSEAHSHDTERDRVGSFADSTSAAPDATLVGGLVRAGLSRAGAQVAAARLREGATLVLARVAGNAAAQVEAILQSAS